MPRHNKAIIVAIVSATTLGLMALDRTHLTLEDAPAAPEAITAATIVPDVTFTLLDGGSVSLHSLAGRTVWLHFWASWCVPCREEFTDLLKRIEKDHGKTILLAVSGDAQAQDAKRFLAPLQHEYKTLFDTGRVIVAHDPKHKLIEGIFQTFQYPETIIIDDRLIMRQKIIGVFR